MPGTTRELTNTSDFPRTTSLSGSEVLPAADGANPVALPVSLFQSKADADDQDSRISAVEGRDVGSSVGTYDTTAEGISATVSGEFFWAPNGDYLQLYENVSEVATAQENVVLPLALVTQDIYEKIGPLDLKVSSSVSGYAFGLVDSSGRLALGVKTDGSVEMPGTPKFDALENRTTALSDIAWGVLDADGRMALGVNNAGNVVAKGEEVDLGAFAGTVNDMGDKLYPALTVDCWGDSLTHGNTTGVTTPYPSALATLLTGRTINNKGLTGRTSLQIATAFGSVPSLITVNANTIPASGAVSVALTENGNFSTKSNVGTINVLGELFGIAGTLAVQLNATTPEEPGTTTFTRSITGSETLIPNNTPFIPSTNDWEGNTVVIWSGRNDVISYKAGNTEYDNDFILGNIAAMVEFLSPLQKRFIVLTVTDSGAEYVGAANQADEDAFLRILALNKEIMRRYPRNAIDVRKILVNNYDNGEPADVTAFSRDQVPPSLQQDGLHLNDAGYAIVAQAVADFINAKGW